MTKTQNYKLIPYQIDDTKTLDVTQIDDDVWLTQRQMAELFDIDKSVITKHLQNIFKEQELDKNSVSAFFAHTANDGKKYNVNFYNLDAIISVGYRVNSKRGVMFRQWATKVIKERIKQDYSKQKKLDTRSNNKLLALKKERKDLINLALKAKGVTKTQISQELGVNVSTVSGFINSDSSNQKVLHWLENNIFNFDKNKSLLDKIKGQFRFSDTEMNILIAFFSCGRVLREYIFAKIYNIFKYDRFIDGGID